MTMSLGSRTLASLALSLLDLFGRWWHLGTSLELNSSFPSA